MSARHRAVSQQRPAAPAGVWLDVDDGIAIQIRGPADPELAAAGARASKRRRERFAAGDYVRPEDDVSTCVDIMTDWRGVSDETGAPLPFSGEAARELLTGNPFLLAEILNRATALVGRRAARGWIS